MKHTINLEVKPSRTIEIFRTTERWWLRDVCAVVYLGSLPHFLWEPLGKPQPRVKPARTLRGMLRRLRRLGHIV